MKHSRGTRFFTAIQIAGSALAAYVLLLGLPESGQESTQWPTYIVILGLCFLGFAAGLAFWLGKLWGYYTSVALYIVQLVHVTSSWIAYKLAFGISVAVNVVGPDGWLNVNFGSQTVLWIAPELADTNVSINIFAGFALAFLFENAKKQKSET